MSPVPMLSLTDAIVASELSRAEVARALGVRPEQVWRWESTSSKYASRSPSAAQIDTLGRVLRLSVMQQARLVSWLAARQNGELDRAALP